MSNKTVGQIVRRHRDSNAVPHEDPDVELLHLPGEPSQHADSVIQENYIISSASGFRNFAFDANQIISGQFRDPLITGLIGLMRD